MKKENKNNDEFLTITDVAKLLKINRALAYSLAKKQSFHFVKVGKLWRISRRNLEKDLS